MQWIAMLTMLIDHIGVVFLPDEPYLRIIGRIAFPIYVYLAVLGYTRTSNISHYIMRLIALALLSQLPFMLAFNIDHINVIGTLALGIIVIKCIDLLKGKPYFYVPIALAAFLVVEYFMFDYGAYGILLMLLYRFFMQHSGKLIGLHLILELIFMYLVDWQIQFFALFVTLVLITSKELIARLDQARAPIWVWRLFYPVHLILLFLFVRFL